MCPVDGDIVILEEMDLKISTSHCDSGQIHSYESRSLLGFCRDRCNRCTGTWRRAGVVCVYLCVCRTFIFLQDAWRGKASSRGGNSSITCNIKQLYCRPTMFLTFSMAVKHISHFTLYVCTCNGFYRSDVIINKLKL